MDSDVANADSHLHVEFYVSDDAMFKGKPFVRIVVPGDKTNIIEQPVREDHKERFPRQWLYFQMKQNEQEGGNLPGISLKTWAEDEPETLNKSRMEELQILKFQTVEQVATASDSQLQRIGMGASGLRERARLYLTRKNKSDSAAELENTRRELNEIKAQMSELLAVRRPGRPPRQQGSETEG